MNAAINRAIDDLNELANMLGDELVEQSFDQQLTPRGKACQEALQTAGVLATKLHAIVQTADIRTRQLELSGCVGCNDA